MADVSKIKIGNVTYDIKDEESRTTLATKADTTDLADYLPLSGGEMTGQLQFSTSGYRTSNDSGYYIDTYGNFHHINDSSSASWNIQSYNGTKVFTVDLESGKVTNGNNFESGASIYLRDSVTLGTAPSSDVWGRDLSWHDSPATSNGGQIRMIYRSSGLNQLHISANNKVSGTLTENFLRLGMNADGTRNVAVSDATAWRNALGASSGVFPVSVGGTGGTDSGWQTLTNTSVFTGDFKYRKIGKWVLVWIHSVNLKSALSGTGARILGTLPTGYRPPYNMLCRGAGAISVGSMNFESNGQVDVYRNTNQTGNIGTTDNIHCTMMYMIS